MLASGGGLHYRFSLLKGIETAKDVTDYALERNFLPVEDGEGGGSEH